MSRRGKRIRLGVISTFGLLALSVIGVVTATAVTGPNGVTATFSPESPNGNNGFYTSPVDISYSGTVPEDNCSAPETYNGPDSPTATVTGTCTPAGGGDPYSDTFQFPYDATPPQIGGSQLNHEGNTANGFQGTGYVVSPANADCTPGPGVLFSVGPTTIQCSASDAAGNTSNDSFVVQVTDTTGPEFGPTPNVPQEGNVLGGFQGAAYALPTATDLVTGGVIGADLECAPLPGATFPLGDTTVDCTATDGNGNTTDADFDVTVADTTAPLFQTPPGAVTVQAANLNTGTPASNACITRFLNVMVTDLVDGSPTVSHNAPSNFQIGSTEVTFTATDASGNIATAIGTVTIAAGDQGPCTVDRRPPRNVRKVKVRPGNKIVKLCWKKPPNADFWRVQIYRKRATQGGLGAKVYQGRSRCFRDRGVRNGVQYMFSLYSRDHAGNYSTGIAKLATPRRILLLRPRDYGVVRAGKPRLFRWARRAGADYYNIQILRMPSGRVVLSKWPQKRKYMLPKKWRFEGRQRLRPGPYIWYVWPGYGSKRANNYGKVMGPGHFRVKKRN